MKDACFCIGPQNGQPLCPCMMKKTKVIDGRLMQDLGPAPETKDVRDFLPFSSRPQTFVESWKG